MHSSARDAFAHSNMTMIQNTRSSRLVTGYSRRKWMFWNLQEVESFAKMYVKLYNLRRASSTTTTKDFKLLLVLKGQYMVS